MEHVTLRLPARMVEVLRDMATYLGQEREYREKAMEQRALRAEAELTTQQREAHTVAELQAREQEIAAQRLVGIERAKFEALVDQHRDELLAQTCEIRAEHREQFERLMGVGPKDIPTLKRVAA